MNTTTYPIQAVMNEYVVWGGPIVTRSVAFADMKARGFGSKAIDVCVFGRAAVPAPEDPEAHLAMFRTIEAMNS